MTSRIQVCDQVQNFVRGWRTPDVKMGEPCGLTVSQNGLLMVANSHYHRNLFYRTDATLVDERTIGGKLGLEPGECGYVTDVLQDSKRNHYVSAYRGFDRIQKFSPRGELLLQWEGRGEADGLFLRPQSLDADEFDQFWVADFSTNRI